MEKVNRVMKCIILKLIDQKKIENVDSKWRKEHGA